ncbi:hypothetical protein [Pseudomonas sp. CF161]|uniref:hypothetical protein n=1 Tax=Pseudomonas sp. CF161 TaxID=911241 RepID=UPI0003553EAB|nr:hypothetical protein [Pseudomonas sp. CF161]EPL14415.1 hypothetical protein CF161_08481 [Pseudomonas sp. CF161]
MTTTIRFATQGELISLMFAAFGILPRKAAERSQGLDESWKKSVQKQLQRLNREEGALTSNLASAIDLFSRELYTYLPTDTRVVGCTGEVLSDLYETYNELIKNEGTFLDQAQTLRYFITVEAIPALALSLTKHSMTYRLGDLRLCTPDDEWWYLPSWNAEGQICLPLEKVMRWAYRLCRLSQMRFHNPPQLQEDEEEKDNAERRLKSAVRWVRGKNVPSLPELHTNFSDSFDNLARHGHVISKAVQDSIRTALVFARSSSFLIKALVEQYGTEYVQQSCHQYQCHVTRLAEDLQGFKDQANTMLEQAPAPYDRRQLWDNACVNYWHEAYQRLKGAQHVIGQRQEQGGHGALADAELQALARDYGKFNVGLVLDRLEQLRHYSAPEHFAHMLHAGFDLKRAPDTRWADIDAYASQLQRHGLSQHLCWMEPWLRATYHYRQEDYVAALGYYQTAFDLAKYRAGKNQYPLVNQYIEVAAKQDAAVKFRQGIEWAQYLGLPVRWLRDDEPTTEKLEFVRYMHKIARYAQL